MRFPLEVVREVRRVISLRARRPFLLGYRISPEEPGDGALRVGDALALVDTLIEDSNLDYLHASLYSVLAGKPLDADDGRTTAELFIERVAGRLPLMAAGELRMPGDARTALDGGLSFAAIGRGLVLDPQWVEKAVAAREGDIVTTLYPDAEAVGLKIPAKLFGVIRSNPGWFPARPVAMPEPASS